jgi:hypothetical protein
MRAPDELRNICRKISLAYRVRQDSISKRRRILEAMEKDHSLDATESLKRILSKERKLLDILIKDEKLGMTLVSYASQILTNAIENRHSIIVGGTIISDIELGQYFRNTKALIERMEKNAEHSKSRMNAELHMLKHNSDAHVKRFIRLWNKELDENTRLVVFFRETISRQRPLHSKILGLKAYHIREAGILAEIAMVVGVLKGFLEELEIAFGSNNKG